MSDCTAPSIETQELNCGAPAVFNVESVDALYQEVACAKHLLATVRWILQYDKAIVSEVKV